MAIKRKALAVLTRAELLEVGRSLSLDVSSGMRLDELVDIVAGSKKARLDRVLGMLSRDTLKSICFAVGISAEGREKEVLRDRILTKARGDDGEPEGDASADQRKIPRAAQASAASSDLEGALIGDPAPVGKGSGKVAPPSTTGPQQDLLWEAFPLLERPSPVSRTALGEGATAPLLPAQRSANGTGGAGAALKPASWEITLDVAPKRPRVAWQGMWRKELAVSVPTQVVEIVRPGRAVRRGDELALDTRVVASRDTTSIPPNRLIWTNDNLVALQTLIDEKDPVTRDWRYRGKVDLIYIDPPFMVNSDFRADNTVDIDLDEGAGVQAKKEPSLVEILAYRDTWRQGLDSFLTMLRQRLVLLKDLLAPTGSIYVHLDWHAVHYVKVLMDEVFGYENFVNEIVWPSTNAHSDAERFGNIHQTLLLYSAGPTKYFLTPRVPYSADYIQKYFTRSDEKGKFRPGDLTAPGGRGPRYRWKGVERNWRVTEENMRVLENEGRIFYTSNGIPRRKEYLEDLEGSPVQSIWNDDEARYIVSWTQESLGYPTQKPVALLERVISASCPPHGLVLDCFLGSGSTIEAAERLGRRWIGIDCGKYAIHLARKRLIQLHGQPQPVEKPQYDYVECEHCSNVERKEKPQRSPGVFAVRPFTVENMGVYQRAEEWQDFQVKRSRYRDEMIKVFGGEPVAHSPLLHGRKGASWVHVGPLDGPISESQVWSIAREAQRTNTRAVTVLSADFDTLSGSDKDGIKEATGVAITVRVIPSAALDEGQAPNRNPRPGYRFADGVDGNSSVLRAAVDCSRAGGEGPHRATPPQPVRGRHRIVPCEPEASRREEGHGWHDADAAPESGGCREEVGGAGRGAAEVAEEGRHLAEICRLLGG